MDLVNNDLILYLNKLVKTIEEDASFEFGNIKIVNQRRIDDILCCIDINIPEVLQRYRKEHGNDRNISSFTLYKSLISNIKRRLPFAKSSYVVKYREVVELVRQLQRRFVTDASYIARTYPELL